MSDLKKYDSIPDDLLGSDPEAQKALRDPSAYRAYLDKLNSVDQENTDNDPGQDVDVPPSTVDEGREEEIPSGGSHVVEDVDDVDDVDVVLDEKDYDTLRKVGLLDDKGKFLTKYTSVAEMLKGIAHKDKAISAKFGDWIKNNPEEAKALLKEQGVEDTPETEPPVEPESITVDEGTDADLEARIEQIVKENIPAPESVLAERFKADLEEIGATVPTTAKEWRDLADVSPGLHAEMREAYHDEAAKASTAERLLRQGAKALEQRVKQTPEYEAAVIAQDTEALRKRGIPDDLIQKAVEGVKSLRKSRTEVDESFYHDRDNFGQRIYAPVLKPGAVDAYLRMNMFDEAAEALATARLKGAKAQRAEYYTDKRKRASLFPPSMAGVPGEGREDRRGASHPRPTPEQYRDAGWQDQNLRTQEDRNAVKRWIEKMSPDKRRQYR